MMGHGGWIRTSIRPQQSDACPLTRSDTHAVYYTRIAVVRDAPGRFRLAFWCGAL